MAVYAITLVYLVIWIAYARIPGLGFYRRVGDYSYSTYAYAFPIEQWVVATLPGAHAMTIAMLAAPITLAFAIPSWHLLEQPFLRRKPAARPRDPRR